LSVYSKGGVLTEAAAIGAGIGSELAIVAAADADALGETLGGAAAIA